MRSVFQIQNTMTLQIQKIDKCFDDDNDIKVKTLTALIKNAIGYDYYITYKNYFDSIFDRCEKNNFYINVSNDKDYSCLIDILHNKLIDIKHIYKVCVAQLSNNNVVIKNGLRLKALHDVDFIMALLFKLDKIGEYTSTNSFQNFYKKLRCNIINTDFKMLPRSIVNFSAFKFCIPGYPYETKSGKIYSISNVCTDDKVKRIELYYKNIDALMSFINDMEIYDKSHKDYELNTLELSFGIMIVLIAMSAEETQYESIVRKEYGNGGFI